MGISVRHSDSPFTWRQDTTTTPGSTYIGKAAPGSSESDPVWQIQKVVGDTSGIYADGDAEFNNVWADRASLSYS